MEHPPSIESNQEIRLGDLLRLKRYETPPAEFWSTFDRELEKKRLQYLVKRESLSIRFLREVMARMQPAMALIVFSLVSTGSFFLWKHHDISGSSLDLQGQELAGQPLLGESVVVSPPAALKSDVHVSAGSSSRPTGGSSMLARADFGVDVIASKPQTQGFRRFTTDMEPSSFSVSDERTRPYGSDALGLENVRMASTSSVF